MCFRYNCNQSKRSKRLAKRILSDASKKVVFQTGQRHRGRLRGATVRGDDDNMCITFVSTTTTPLAVVRTCTLYTKKERDKVCERESLQRGETKTLRKVRVSCKVVVVVVG